MGWRGIEGRDVMVEVRYNGDSSLYELVTPDMAPRIVQSHMEEHRPVRRWAVGQDFEAYYEAQTLRISELLGRNRAPLPGGLPGLRRLQGAVVLLQPGLRLLPAKGGGCRFLRVFPDQERPLRHQLVHLAGGEPTPHPGGERARRLLPKPPRSCCCWKAVRTRYWKAFSWRPRPSTPRAAVVYLPGDAPLAAERLQAAWARFMESHILPEPPALRLTWFPARPDFWWRMKISSSRPSRRCCPGLSRARP